MHKYRVTVEKIVEVLEKSESVIEVKTSEDKLMLRNKDWANIMTVNINIIDLETYPY